MSSTAVNVAFSEATTWPSTEIPLPASTNTSPPPASTRDVSSTLASPVAYTFTLPAVAVTVAPLCAMKSPVIGVTDVPALPTSTSPVVAVTEESSTVTPPAVV